MRTANRHNDNNDNSDPSPGRPFKRILSAPDSHRLGGGSEFVEVELKTDIWIPIYIGDYLADTIGLTLSQHGAYLLVIFAYWKNKGPIPSEIAKSVMRDASPTDCRRIASFFRISCGKWHHARIDSELLKASSNGTSRSNAASIAAKARWAAKNTTSVTDASRMRHAVPSPSPSQVPQRTTKLPPSDKTAFSQHQKNITARFHAALNSEWENDRQKWMGRIKQNPDDAERVLADLELAAREGEIKTTPAKYAEHRWKEFA